MASLRVRGRVVLSGEVMDSADKDLRRCLKKDMDVLDASTNAVNMYVRMRCTERSGWTRYPVAFAEIGSCLKTQDASALNARIYAVNWCPKNSQVPILLQNGEPKIVLNRYY